MSNEQKPSIGRIVHYVTTLDSEPTCGVHMAAIVTYVGSDGTVGLTVFDFIGGTFHRSSVSHADNFEDGTWHWPERV